MGFPKKGQKANEDNESSKSQKTRKQKDVDTTSEKNIKKIRKITMVEAIILMLYSVANNGKFSGRADGNVYMANGRTRAYKKPRRVLNANTESVKAILAFFSSAYKTLTQSQQNAWLSFIYKHSDRFQHSIDIKGKNAFVGLNANISNVGGTAILNPPVGSTSPGPTQHPNLTIVSGVMTLNYDTNTDGATTILQMTAPLSAGINAPSQSQFRIIIIEDTSSAGPITITGDYVARFGIPPIGSKVFAQLKVVDAATGLESALTQTFAVSA